MTEVAARPARTERNILPKKNEKTWGGRIEQRENPAVERAAAALPLL